MAVTHHGQIFLYLNQEGAPVQLKPAHKIYMHYKKYEKYLLKKNYKNDLFYLKVHFDLRESIVISSKTDFVIPTTVQIPEAHFVHSLFRACAYIGNVHGSPESLRGRSVGENACKMKVM